MRSVRFLLAGLLVVVGVVQMQSVGGFASSAQVAVDRSRPFQSALTLVTGDRVIVRGKAIERIVPGSGRDGLRFDVYWLDGDLYAIPFDAGRLLAAGLVDERLFNVTQQLEWGYGDRHRNNIPLIAEHASSRPVRIDGARPLRPMAGLGLDALQVSKSRAAAFWRDVTTSNQPRSLDLGVRRLWLDGRVEASLDHSVRQIGAPVAWRRGLNGTGVKVAVLDTGYDPEHPDLAHAVAESRGFTPSGPDDVRDGSSHGTHVASTIAGSGAVSDGRYRGVAPRARLAIGKVLTDTGYGLESWIIAGMRWAARTVRADVINLSLGGMDLRGVDPMERAVNRLTRQTGALFVIAAGNDGDTDHTIGSPGSARAALTVGAVDDNDQLAPFSSRGPRLGDEAIKPDLTAPGVKITAAVPRGRYATLSGTSMATPHVAGAAAILAQQHPTWAPAQLKSALIGSARPTPGLDEFAQGGGRVAIRRAISQPVIASPGNLSTALRYPDHQTVTRPLTYTNTTTRPVSLSLSQVDAPFHLDHTEITVPPGGSRTIDVTISADGVKSGTSATTLTATSGQNVVVRTLLGAYVEPESYDLKIEATDRDPIQNSLMLVHSQTHAFHDWIYLTDGHARTRLPSDHYNVVDILYTRLSRQSYASTLVNQPVDLTDASTDVSIDLRRAKHPTMTLDEPTAVPAWFANVGLLYHRGDAYFGAVDPWGWDRDTIRVLPVQQRGVTYYHYQSWHKDGTRFSPYAYHIVDRREGGIPADPSYAAHTSDLAEVTTTYKSTAPDSQASVFVGLLLADEVQVLGKSHRVRMPGTVTQYFTPHPDLRWPRQVDIRSGRHYLDILDDTGTPPSYQPGDHREVWNAAVLGPALPDSCAPLIDGNNIAPPCGFRDGDQLYWWGDLNLAVDAGDRGRRALDSFDGITTLSRNAKVIDRCPHLRCHGLELPPQRARYTLQVDAHRYDYDSTRLTTQVRIVYTFSSSHAEELTALPLSAVRFAPEGLDAHNRAPANSTTTIPIWIETYSDAPTRSLAVQASFNDGKTWHALDVERHGRDWITSVRNPGSGFVSLRAISADSAQNTVRQTIIRAYQIRGVTSR